MPEETLLSRILKSAITFTRDGVEYIAIPREVFEKEVKMFELVQRLCYGKHLSAEFYKELRDSLTLEEKIELSYRIIEEALRVMKRHCKHKNISVAFSGGKASLVTLKLVVDTLQQQEPELLKDHFIVVYNDTGIEYPENTSYVIKIVKKYFKLPKLVIVRAAVPQLKPFVIWKTFGFPPESRFHHLEPVCCLLLKKLPAALALTRYNIDLEFLGLQTFESRTRLAVLDKVGLLNQCNKIASIPLLKWVYRCTPIGFWSDDDIWNYIERENLPINPVYEKYGISRQGCMFCTNHYGWYKLIRHILEDVLSRPQTWQWFLQVYNKWGVQKERITLLKALEKLGLIELIIKQINKNCKNSKTSKRIKITKIIPFLERFYTFIEF